MALGKGMKPYQDKIYTQKEVFEILRNYAHFLGQREGQHLTTISPLAEWFGREVQKD